MVDLGRPDEAVAILERAAQHAPGHASYQALGQLCERVRHVPRAVDAYSRALAAEPRDVDSYRRLARVLALSGQAERAIQTLEQATHLAPRDPRIRLSLGSLYAAAGRLDDARGQWQALNALDPATAGELGRLLGQR
jgi:tetratricopeptide (TPR) repeat protein